MEPILSESLLKHLDFNTPDWVKKHPLCFKQVHVFKEWPKGWDNIVFNFLDELEEYLIANSYRSAIKFFKINQIKEVNGILKVYCFKGNETIYDIVGKVQSLSRSVCMYCGEPAKEITIDEWNITVCETHELFYRDLLDIEYELFNIYNKKLPEKIKARKKFIRDIQFKYGRSPIHPYSLRDKVLDIWTNCNNKKDFSSLPREISLLIESEYGWF